MRNPVCLAAIALVTVVAVLPAFTTSKAQNINPRQSGSAYLTSQTSQDAPIGQSHSETIVDTAFTVGSGNRQAYKFDVPSDVTNIRVTGHFSATGGANNSIEVFLTNEDGMVNLKNNHHYKRFYFSGRVTNDAIKVILPTGADTYYLVFDNSFALMIPRAVQANASVSYLQ
jgi:hypothetical protein